MKKSIMLLCVAALAVPISALAGVNVNVNLGLPVPVPVPVPPPRVVLPPPPPAVLFDRPPLFLAPPRLGFYVGVDIPYDIVYADNFYYLNYRNAWYRSGSYNGPWIVVQQERLPVIVRRQGVEYIRVHRDREFLNYRRDQDHYRGRRFWPGREVREIRREEYRPGPVREVVRDERWRGPRDWKEERKWDKEERKRDREEWKRERGQGRHEGWDHGRR